MDSIDGHRHIEARPLTGFIGAEIHGVDLSSPIAEAPPYERDRRNLAYRSFLYALETPARGGDTLFTSMYAAYEALSDGLKQVLGFLRAVHSSRHVFGYGALGDSDIGDRLGNSANAFQHAVHAVITRHPDRGRAALYVNPEFTLRFDGWSAEASRPLLDYLCSHATWPEFTCRFRWQKGSVAFWDNRATWHRALNDYPGERRLMHRITVEGARLSRLSHSA